MNFIRRSEARLAPGMKVVFNGRSATSPQAWAAAIAAALVCGLVAGDERADTALDACGMPRNYRPTSHCFNDRTHHTCCLLGPEARKYADASGNPIGDYCHVHNEVIENL